MNDSMAQSTDLVVDIRPATVDDLPAIMAIERDVFPDPWPESGFSDHLSDSNSDFVVAISGGEIVAYGCLMIVDCESHLTNIAVVKEYRRKSVAKQVLDHILSVAGSRNCDYLLLEVRPSNAEARSFYIKHGFELMYHRPEYYRNPVEDALVMVYYFKEAKDRRSHGMV